MAVYPKHFSQRLFTMPRFNSKEEFIPSLLYALLFNATLIYSIFLPFRPASIGFIVGTVIYLISLILFVRSLSNYATTSPDQPVTKGVYAYSRHPQQILATTMWIGCGVATGSMLLILACIGALLLSIPSMKVQERFCLEKYGVEYSTYLKRTPRFFLC
jgi:protein-S-isoprenylcysteine O-methyltransferase Ste14